MLDERTIHAAASQRMASLARERAIDAAVGAARKGGQPSHEALQRLLRLLGA